MSLDAESISLVQSSAAETSQFIMFGEFWGSQPNSLASLAGSMCLMTQVHPADALLVPSARGKTALFCEIRTQDFTGASILTSCMYRELVNVTLQAV